MRAVRAWSRKLADWAVRRALAPNSLLGISLLFAFCGAAWFSGGTGNDITLGMLALSGWLVAWVSAGRLATIIGLRTGGSRRPASAVRRSVLSRLAVPGSPASRAARGGTTGSTDWLVLPGVVWDDGSGSVALESDEPADGDLSHGSAARSGTWPGPGSGTWPGSGSGTWPAAGSGTWPAARSFTWLSAVCAVAAECALYGGIAAGGQSAGWTGMWPLAVMTIIAVALRQTIGSCGDFRNESALDSGSPAGHSVLTKRRIGKVLSAPVGARVALAGVALIVHGPRVALFAVLTATVVSGCYAIVAARRPAWAAGSTQSDNPRRGGGSRRPERARPPLAGPTRPGVVLVSRDDGAAARWAGRVVQGNLIPLPAAVAGVGAAVMLSVLGLAHLPGVLAFTPPAVMMLAAPGSSHPHDGRFDWLVPAVLQLGQYVYLAALGFARAVPGPVVYSLCALTAAWYANRVADSAGTLAMLRRKRDEGSPPAVSAGTPIGWEGRMFAVTLGAVLGMATFAYLAVTAYLGLLIGRKAIIGCVLPREDDRG